MERENDFSWNVNKSVSNKDDNKVVPVDLGPAKSSIKTPPSHNDAKAEMEELFENFKHRIADIIYRETDKK